MHLKDISAELIAAYGELRRFLSRRLGNAEDAADVAQSSFVRVYEYALASPVNSPRALLFHTAQSLCIDRGRRRRIEVRALEAVATLEPAVAPSVEQTVSARQTLARIAARLERLPRKRREAFLLVRVHGHTHAEAAAHMGLTVAAIEKHVVRATLDCSDFFSRLAGE